MGLPIQRPEVGAALQRLFRLTGRVKPELEEFILGMVLVGDVSQDSAPGLGRRAVASFNQAAVAGNHFQARFECVPGMIGVVRELRLYSASVQTRVRFHFPGNAAVIAAPGNIAGKSFTDGRLLPGAVGGAQAPAGVLAFGTSVTPFPNNEFTTEVYAGVETVVEDPGWVIGTGHVDLVGFLEFQTVVQNVALGGTLTWDEYPTL